MTRTIGLDHPDCFIQIEDARRLAVENDMQGVLIFGFRRDGVVESITYGDHPAQKVAAGEIADFIMEKLTKGYFPMRTMFGFNNEGRPKRLTQVEKRILQHEGWTLDQIERLTHPEAED